MVYPHRGIDVHSGKIGKVGIPGSVLAVSAGALSQECGALVSLLDRLGYDGNGNHKEGRRLVPWRAWLHFFLYFCTAIFVFSFH